MGGNGSVIRNSNISYSSSGTTYLNNGSEQIIISKDTINIKTSNIKNVHINGEKCLPCEILKKIIEKNKDESLLDLYKKYCS